MFSYARAYVYLLYGESRPASPVAADPLDKLLMRLVCAPVEWLAWRRRAAAPTSPPRLRGLPGGRSDDASQPAASAADRLRPAA